MRSCWSRSSGAVALVALVMAAAGCAGTEEPAPAGDTIAEESVAPAGEATIEAAPTFDDLAGPAVDENDPASVEARALFELVGNNVVGAPPAGASR